MNAFLKFNEQDVLSDKGKVSHDVAAVLAEKEFEIYRLKQDKAFENDFDRLMKNTRLLNTHAKNGNGTKKKRKGKSK